MQQLTLVYLFRVAWIIESPMTVKIHLCGQWREGWIWSNWKFCIIINDRILFGLDFILILIKHLLFCLLDKIWLLFPLWLNLIIFIHLKMKSLVCFMIQNQLVPVLCQVMIIFICLIQLLHLMNPYNSTHKV